MLKLRILLLRNVCYYIILAIAIIYFLITFFFIKYSSNYNNITFLEAKITDITIKISNEISLDNGFNLWSNEPVFI